MSTVPLFILNDYEDGTYDFPPIDIPDGATAADFSIHRCTSNSPTIWPLQSTIVSLWLESSIDGGDWVGMGEAVMPGGISTFKGNELEWAKTGGGLPEGINRRVRGSIQVAGGPLYSEANLEIS